MPPGLGRENPQGGGRRERVRNHHPQCAGVRPGTTQVKSSPGREIHARAHPGADHAVCITIIFHPHPRPRFAGALMKKAHKEIILEMEGFLE